MSALRKKHIWELSIEKSTDNNKGLTIHDMTLPFVEEEAE